ncbi:beta-1,3-galactosyltransferase 1-like [Tubulanus polymorphus]|uniref:beta-1,3-galactosyltransferase 1-like n=1 Tax=Tubulanus polymorphus TaxID=672921 RepID=UPI003DA53127
MIRPRYKWIVATASLISLFLLYRYLTIVDTEKVPIQTHTDVFDRTTEVTGPSPPIMGYLQDIEFVDSNKSAAICRGNPKTIVIVISSTDNYRQRRVIRSTWASKPTSDIRFAFLLGLSADRLWDRFISLEMDTHGDVILFNMIDTYYGLTLKTGALVKWVRDNCRRAKNVIKIDDDMYLDAGQLTSALDAHAHRKTYFMCRVFKTPPVDRDRKSKYYVSKDVWPAPNFPTHCSGPGYAFTANLVPVMWRTALRMKLFNNEDVWWTGIVAGRIRGVKHIKDKRIYLTPRLKNWCETKPFVVAHGLSPENLLAIWRDKMANKTCPPPK